MAYKNGAFSLGANQNITVSGSSQQTTAFGTNTRVIRVAAAVAAFIELGENPTAAAASSAYLPAGSVNFFVVSGGWKAALIQASSGGVVSVTEVS